MSNAIKSTIAVTVGFLMIGVVLIAVIEFYPPFEVFYLFVSACGLSYCIGGMTAEMWANRHIWHRNKPEPDTSLQHDADDADKCNETEDYW